jgi:hypothetical protein
MSGESPAKAGAPAAYDELGGCIPPILTGDAWKKRVTLAMILGVCPIFLLRFPQITAAALLSFISTKEEDLKTLQEGLSSKIAFL